MQELLKKNYLYLFLFAFVVIFIIFECFSLGIILFLFTIILYLICESRESFVTGAEKDEVQQADQRGCLSVPDDDPIAKNRSRTWFSKIPTYLYNAEKREHFLKSCYGNLQRRME